MLEPRTNSFVKWCFFQFSVRFFFNLSASFSVTVNFPRSFSRLPVFVQIHSKSQQLYLGIYESKNFRTDFEMVHLSRIPPPCNYLTGQRCFHLLLVCHHRQPKLMFSQVLLNWFGNFQDFSTCLRRRLATRAKSEWTCQYAGPTHFQISPILMWRTGPKHLQTLLNSMVPLLDANLDN